jgi:mannose-6-phosphate isomerase-like protein (cupin superfamily)
MGIQSTGDSQSVSPVSAEGKPTFPLDMLDPDRQDATTKRGGIMSNSARKPPRRVVTGHSADGRAVVLFDDRTPNKVSRAETGIVAHWVWTTDAAPSDVHGTDDTSAPRRGLTPAPGGSIFRIVDFPPTPRDDEGLDHATISESLGLHADAGKRAAPRHPLMHATETVDYAIILAGAIEMMLDDEIVSLSAGDVVVQQATNHAWINPGPDVCRIAFVLIDAKPY